MPQQLDLFATAADLNLRPSRAAFALSSATASSCQRDIELGQIPIGSIVRTPLGLEAEVIRYFSDGRRGHRDRLVCRYLQPKNRRYAVATLVPELVTVIKKGGG